MQRPDKWLRGRIESAAVTALQKFVPYSTSSQGLYIDEPEPPYQRRFDPQWVYQIRQNHSLINNAIEEKVSQTFRRGWDEWEKEYEAKCPNCKEEFEDETPFRQQYKSVPEEYDLDFDTRRVCPECEEKVQFLTPDPDVVEKGYNYFEEANYRNLPAGHLQPAPEADIGQTFLGVCKEVAWDVQSFDDGWMIFDRSYKLDGDGKVVDYDLQGVHRAPPELMRYSIEEGTGRLGGEYWVCVKCRAASDDYSPETDSQPCSECGSKTYEVYAFANENANSYEDPESFYIRGEFAQASEYEPSKYYGYSPIVTLFDEARTMEKMDDWYRAAYEQRRAPRGALVIKSSNADATRKWNRGQLEKLNNDANHIPTMMDDTEGSGDPIKFVNLLESPADMQHMEMREWIKERISGKYGVTSVMMSGSPENSGLSQSMEVQVSNRSADRLRTIFNEIFVPAFIAQIGMEGWTRGIAPVEEEDEITEAEKSQRHLQIAQQASQLGLEVEWTEDGTTRVKAGEVEMEQEGDGPGGLGAMLSNGEGPGEAPGPPESDGQPQLEPSEEGGGAPDQDKRPAEGNPAFGRMAKDLVQYSEMDVYNEWTGEWEKAELTDKRGDAVIAETESGLQFKIGENGEVATV